MKKVLSDFWQIYKKFLKASLKAKNLRNRYTKKLQKANFSAIRQKMAADSRCSLTYQNRCFQQRMTGDVAELRSIGMLHDVFEKSPACRAVLQNSLTYQTRCFRQRVAGGVAESVIIIGA